MCLIKSEMRQIETEGVRETDREKERDTERKGGKETGETYIER